MRFGWRMVLPEFAFVAELGMVLKALGMDLSDTELMDLISEIDTDGKLLLNGCFAREIWSD